jgi:hypothetical protein
MFFAKANVKPFSERLVSLLDRFKKKHGEKRHEGYFSLFPQHENYKETIRLDRERFNASLKEIVNLMANNGDKKAQIMIDSWDNRNRGEIRDSDIGGNIAKIESIMGKYTDNSYRLYELIEGTKEQERATALDYRLAFYYRMATAAGIAFVILCAHALSLWIFGSPIATINIH